MSISTSTRWPSVPVPSRHPVRPAALGRLPHDVVAFLREVLGDDQGVDRPTDRLVRRVAEEPRRGGVPAGDRLIAIHRHHRDRADLDERFEVLLLLAVALLRLLRRLEQPSRSRSRSPPAARARRGSRGRSSVNGFAARVVRQTAIMPMTWPRATSGAAIRRSCSSYSAPGIWTPRGSPRTSLTTSAVPRSARSPTIPSPGVIVSLMRASPNSPRATTGTKTAFALQEDRARVGVEELAGAVADLAQDRLEVEESADLAPQLRQRRHLARTASGLGVEAGVLDRDTDVRGDRGERAACPSSLKRPACSMLCTLITPIAVAAGDDRDTEVRLGRASPPPGSRAPRTPSRD